MSKFKFDVNLPTMKNALFTIFALALFTAGFIPVAHAHLDKQDMNHQLELAIDQDNIDNYNDLSGSLCDMHCHNHIAPVDFSKEPFPKITGRLLSVLSQSTVSSPVYELKRPPRI